MDYLSAVVLKALERLSKTGRLVADAALQRSGGRLLGVVFTQPSRAIRLLQGEGLPDPIAAFRQDDLGTFGVRRANDDRPLKIRGGRLARLGW